MTVIVSEKFSSSSDSDLVVDPLRIDRKHTETKPPHVLTCRRDSRSNQMTFSLFNLNNMHERAVIHSDSQTGHKQEVLTHTYVS